MIRLGILGTGGVARHVVELLGTRDLTGIEVVGAATADESVVGEDLAEIVGTGQLPAIPIVGSLDELLDKGVDVVVDASRSFLADIVDDVVKCAQAGANFVSSCEELAYGLPDRADAWARIDKAARDNGVTVLGTGVNPGFIFDQLVLSATGVCWDIEQISGRRVVDVAGFGAQIHQRLGIGYSLEDFEAGHEDGSIAGHVGFPESIAMVVEGLGLELDEPVTQTFEPHVAETAAPTLYGEVPVGETEGFLHSAVGRVNGQDFVRFELLLHLRPEEAGFPIGDSLEIQGRHPVNLQMTPGMVALDATAAHVVNSIPVVLDGPPGAWPVRDLPAATAWLGGITRARTGSD